MATTARLIARLSLEDSEYRRKMLGAIALSDRLGAHMTRIGTRAITGGILAAAGGAAALAVGLKKSIDAAAGLQSMRAEFETMLGSEARAKALVSTIKDMADVTPFGSAGLTSNVRTMIAFGVEADRAMDYLRMLGDVAGADQERLDRLTLAFSQVFAAGKLSGQDLLQFVNAGFNPLQEIAKSTGKSMGELRKDMEAGEISAQMVANAFRQATSEGGRFFGNMQRQSKTWNGLMSTIADKWQNVLAAFGTPLIDELSPALERWIDKLSAIEKMAPGVATGLIADIKDAISGNSVDQAIVELGGKLIRGIVSAMKAAGEAIMGILTNAFAGPIANLQARVEYMLDQIRGGGATPLTPQETQDRAKLGVDIQRAEKALKTAKSDPGASTVGGFFFGKSGSAEALKFQINAMRVAKAALDQKAADYEIRTRGIEERTEEILGRGVRTGFDGGKTAEEWMASAREGLMKTFSEVLPKTARAASPEFQSFMKSAEAMSWRRFGMPGAMPFADVLKGRGADYVSRVAQHRVDGIPFNDGRGSRLGLSENLLHSASRAYGEKKIWSQGRAPNASSIWRSERMAAAALKAKEELDIAKNTKTSSDRLEDIARDVSRLMK